MRQIAEGLLEAVVRASDRFRLLGVQASHWQAEDEQQLVLWREAPLAVEEGAAIGGEQPGV